jgi:hypothetical protein
MKKILLSLLVLFTISIHANAQDTAAFKKDLLALLKDAQNEFADNQSALQYDDTAKHKQYFSSKITLGSTEHIIQQKKDELGTCKVFLCSYDFEDMTALTNAITYTPILLDELNKMHQSGNYRGRDFKTDDGSNVTELTDAQGNYVMEIESNSKAMVVRLYAKSWGKR